MSASAFYLRLRSWLVRSLYFVGGPLLGLPLLLVALFLGSSGPPSWKLTVLGAMAGYVGLWLAFLDFRGGRGVRAVITSTLLIVGLLSLGPYTLQVSQIFVKPPLSVQDIVVAALFFAPVAVAAHYLLSQLLRWRVDRRTENMETKNAAS